MTQEEFLGVMTYLGYAYNKGFTKEEVSVWYDFFNNYTLDEMECAVKRVIPKNKFLPSIAELKSELALIKNPILQMDANDEWQKAITTIRKNGRYRIAQTMKELGPHSKDIIEQIGIERICNSTNIEWERKMFLDLFNNKQAQETNYQLVGPYLTKLEMTRSDIGLIE
jgi:hypothetical protein